MLFWTLAALMSLLSLAVVLWPLLRRPSAQTDPASMAAVIYKDQIAEIERDVARGVLDSQQAQAARAEIGRRLLATQQGGGTVGRDGGRWLALALLPTIPAAAIALYLSLGQPEFITGTQQARTVAAAAGEHDDLRPLVTELQTRLQTNPADGEGWVTLARTHFQLGDHQAAVEAYGKAIALAAPEDVALRGERAEALVLGADGIVTEAAQADFAAVLAVRPNDARGSYYAALALAQGGKLREALQAWQSLVQNSPAGAPWLPAVRDQIRAVAESLGEDPDAAAQAPAAPAAPAMPQAGMSGASPEATALARQLLRDAAKAAGLELASESSTLAKSLLAQTEPPRGPTAEQVAEAAKLPAAEQQAMIDGMVAGLAEKLANGPADPDGWMRLARAYLVQGKAGEAVSAYEKAAAQAPDRPDVQAAYAEALIMTSADGSIPESAAKLLNRVLLLDPMNPRALWHMGRLAATQGDAAQARALWTRLLTQIEPGTREHALVSEAIAKLP